MPRDPRRFLQEPDDLEKRLEVIFATIGTPKTARPTDLASALLFLQELYDKLAPGGNT